MPLDKEWIDLLVCPETRQPVKLADDALIQRLNAKVDAGELVTVSGAKVNDPIEAGLVREDGKVLYVVQNEIPNMLADEAIDLETPDDPHPGQE